MKRDFLTFRESGSQFLVAAAAMYVMQVIFQYTLPQTITIGGVTTSTWVILAANQTAFLAAVFAFARFRRISVFDTARLKTRLNDKQVLVVFLISIFCFVTFLPLANIFLTILSAMGFHLASGFPEGENFGVFILELFLIGIAPAFAEELLMRGMVLNGFKSRNYVFAVLASALFFSLMHGSALQTVHQFGLGIMLAIVLLTTQSFWAAFLLHLFNNAMSLIISTYIPSINNFSLGGWNYLLWAFLVPFGIFMLVVLSKLLRRLSDQTPRFRIVDEDEVADVFGFSAPVSMPRVPASTVSYRQFGVLFKESFRSAAVWIGNLFKRGGIKHAAYVFNQDVAAIDRDAHAMQGERIPLSVWIAFAMVAANWLLNLLAGFLDL